MLASPATHSTFTPIPGVMIFGGDCRSVLPLLEPNSFDAIVTSPPHWGKVSYLAEDDPLKPQELGLDSDPNDYLDRMAIVFQLCFGLVKPGGSLILDITDTSNNESPVRRRIGDRVTGTKFDRRRKILDSHREKELLPITDWLRLELQAIGWLFRREIIWVKTRPNGAIDDGYSRRDVDAPAITHQKLLYLIKPKKTSGREYAAYYRDVGGGTVWFSPPDTDPVHPCPMPIAIADRAVRMTCPIGGRVLDPFCGSGATLIAAAQDSEGAKRQAFGIELGEEFVARACDRLIREVGKPMQRSLFSPVTSPSPVGTCPPSDRPPNMTKAHAPTGWVEPKGSKQIFRYKSGKKRPSLTLEGRGEEVLCRILNHHRIYHQEVKQWILSFRGNAIETLANLRSILPPQHIEAIEQAGHVDIEVQEILGQLGIH